MLALMRPVWLLAAFALAGPSESPLKSGMVIERSVTIRPGTYRLSSPTDLTRPALTIRGDNITVDFNGAVLARGPEAADPDLYTRFALVAEGAANLPPGQYNLQVISDDGVRVWMDDAMILDEWLPHESKVSRVPIAGGAHRFKVVYYDVTGFAELRFDIQRK
jgi:hypothetical protein